MTTPRDSCHRQESGQKCGHLGRSKVETKVINVIENMLLNYELFWRAYLFYKREGLSLQGPLKYTIHFICTSVFA